MEMLEDVAVLGRALPIISERQIDLLNNFSTVAIFPVSTAGAVIVASSRSLISAIAT
jgi:hypothetical protein